jgi:hypothetical protein
VSDSNNIIFLETAKSKEIKQIHELVKYISQDLQTFLAGHEHISAVEVIGSMYWEITALLEGMGYDAAEVFSVVYANYINARQTEQ